VALGPALGEPLGATLGNALLPALGEPLGAPLDTVAGSLVGRLVLFLPVPTVIRIPSRASVGEFDEVALGLSLGAVLGPALSLGDELDGSLGALSPSSVGDRLSEDLGKRLGGRLGVVPKLGT
jgi:hypothetical protein